MKKKHKEENKKHFLTISTKELLFWYRYKNKFLSKAIMYYRASEVVQRNTACCETQSTLVTVKFALDSFPLLLNYRPRKLYVKLRNQIHRRFKNVKFSGGNPRLPWRLLLHKCRPLYKFTKNGHHHIFSEHFLKSL